MNQGYQGMGYPQPGYGQQPPPVNNPQAPSQPWPGYPPTQQGQQAPGAGPQGWQSSPQAQPTPSPPPYAQGQGTQSGYGQPNQSVAMGAVPPPPFHTTDEDLVAEEYHQTEQRLQRSGGAGFLRLLGPSGQAKWDASVPPGYEASVRVRFCCPWAPGKRPYHHKRSYFWKSRTKPMGASITIPPTNCLVTRAFELAAQSQDDNLRTFVKNFGRPRDSYLYNVINLENVNAHIQTDGTMRPMILDERSSLHAKLGAIFREKDYGGINAVLDYQRGRTIKILRKKTGTKLTDIEWNALVVSDPSPMPQEFWPALHALWDLEAMVRYPTVEEQQAAIIDMGLPMPSMGHAQGQVPASYGGYSAAPHAPYPNPYQQPQQPMQPQYQQPQQPQYQQPPPMQPPLISSSAPALPAFSGPPPIAASPSQSDLAMPSIPIDRQGCFGKINPTDNWCKSCPDQVRAFCAQRSAGGAQQTSGPDPRLMALQQQLQG